LFDVYYKELRVVGSHINPKTYAKALGMMDAMGARQVDSIGI
jgi:hypothetical protein